jgi:hypothetical protein
MKYDTLSEEKFNDLPIGKMNEAFEYFQNRDAKIRKEEEAAKPFDIEKRLLKLENSLAEKIASLEEKIELLDKLTLSIEETVLNIDQNILINSLKKKKKHKKTKKYE